MLLKITAHLNYTKPHGAEESPEIANKLLSLIFPVSELQNLLSGALGFLNDPISWLISLDFLYWYNPFSFELPPHFFPLSPLPFKTQLSSSNNLRVRLQSQMLSRMRMKHIMLEVGVD